VLLLDDVTRVIYGLIFPIETDPGIAREMNNTPARYLSGGPVDLDINDR
jgi:hypothetical protein